MQYAQIVPNTKTDIENSIFTYKIPAELLAEIQTGSLVQIPFAGRKLKGLVLDIKKRKPQAAISKKLRKIEKILVSKSYLTNDQIKLAHWLSKYYHSPLSTVLFAILPEPPLKKSKPVQKTIKKPKISSEDLLLKLRFYYFKKLIQKILKNKKQTILLFPQVEMAKIFYYYFKKLYGGKIILYHSGQSKTEKWQNYNKILEQQSAQVIIGSQIAVFAPAKNLGQIIIDTADSQNFKQEREPRYDVRKVAEKLAQFQKAKIIFFTSAVPLEFVKSIKKKKIAWLRPKTSFLPKIQLVDLNQEYLRQNYKLLSEKVQQKLIANHKAQKKSILFINKKGTASVVICRDCNHVFRCPKCDSTLTFRLRYSKSSQVLVCHNCNFQDKLSSLCPKCRGPNLRFLGGGTEKVETEVKKIIPMAIILRIEKNLKIDTSQKYDIIIATQKMFSNFFRPAELVVAVQPDLTLNLPDFRASEKTYQLAKWLKLYAKKDFIIQTHHTGHFVFQSILKNSDRQFYAKELALRKKEGYPPFGKLIKLSIADPKPEEAKKNAEALAEKLVKINKRIEILGPAPAYTVKKGEKYVWQIVLKGKNPENFLSHIPKDWKIDIDPVSLL